MSVKTSGVGHFQIPTAAAAGTSCTSGAANTYTTNAVQLIASTAAALYITGIYAEEAAVSAATYKSVQLMIGTAGAETIIGQYLIAPSTGSTVTRTYRAIFPPIPVAISTRIAVKTADSAGSLATLISLECIAQSNVVDDGIAVTTVTTVTNQLTAAQVATGVWQDATSGDFTTTSSIGKSLYTTGATPGAAGGLFIAGTNAATTITTALTTTFTGSLTGSVASVTAGVTLAASAVQAIWDALTSALTTVGSIGKLIVTNLDALISSRMATYTQPTGFLAATFPTSVASPTNITAGTITTVTNVTNAPTAGDFTSTMKTSLNAATPASVTGAVGSVTGLTAANLDVAVSTLATSAQAVAIKAKTDSLNFTVAGQVDSNLQYVNDVAVTGNGSSSPFSV